MNCGLLCLIGVSLLASMVWTMMVGKDNKVFKDFEALLNEEQKQ